MKVFLSFVCFAICFQIGFAIFGINLRNSRFKEYELNREPSLQNSVPFSDTVQERWIEQRLDNFNSQNNATWFMRYLENSNYLEEGSPIFILVGGEWTISEGLVQSGHVYDMARNLSGIMFYTEHRYYGHSHPVEDLQVENMRFLSMDQAIADLANFIVQIKATIPEIRNSGVILVGGSYSATMATFFIQKYPHLVNGVWSSSAPLKAQVDFVEYMEVVSEAMETFGDPSCTERIQTAFEEMEQLVADGNSSFIKEKFHFCYPLDLENDLDIWSFFTDMKDPFAAIVQNHQPGDLEKECEYLMSRKGPSAMEALAQWYFGDLESYPGLFCYDHTYKTSLYYFSQTEWNSIAALFAMRQMFYQTCSEYGWYQSSGSNNTIFGSMFPADLYIQLCHDSYDGIFTADIIQRNIDRTNVIYGGLNPGPIRNLYTTHGQYDPWRPLGIQSDLNQHSPTVILPLESHVSDLSSIHESDSPEMRASKERIFELVQEWLQQ